MRWLVVIMLVGGAETIAHATAPDDATVADEARRLHEAGRQRFAEGRYEEAITLWEQGYAVSGHRGFLFNIASAQERLQRDEATIATLREYQSLAPPEEHASLDQRIAALEARIAASAPTGEAGATPHVARRSRRLAVAAAVTGGVAAAVGTAFAVSSERLDRRGSEQCTATGLCTRDAEPYFEASARHRTLAISGWVLGGLAVGSAAWLSLRRDASSGPRIEVSMGPGPHVGVRWSQR